MNFIQADWPAPSHIKAFTSTRQKGISKPPYEEFNLGDHVGDCKEAVLHNRKKLKEVLNLVNEPIWIRQTHSTIAIEAIPQHRFKEADACFTTNRNQVCVVLTADCLPILICNKQGTCVAAIHAGWRGLLNGIIDSTFKAFHSSSDIFMAWLGPAISSWHYEVGEEVRTAFLNQLPEAVHAFAPSPHQRWLADLYALARLKLQKQGVKDIYGGEYCTFSEKERFYSYRRDGEKTGRMASLIWIQ